MSGSRFKIMDATRRVYSFLGREYRYLGRVCLLPLGATIILNMFIGRVLDTGGPVSGASPFTYGLLSLPANALMGWYVFLLARALFLGERLDNLPGDPAALARRKQSMQAGIIGFILIKMMMTALTAAVAALEEINIHNPSAGLSFCIMILIGGGVWSLRFIAAPLLWALGYPVRGYAYRVRGLGISLRILALSFLSIVPIAIVVQLIMSAFLPDHLQTFDNQMKIVTALGPVASYVFSTLFFGSLAFGLKEMLAPPQRRAR
jgi:hypothetical protein